MIDVVRYVIDPTAPFPKRWRDPRGPIRVLAGPVKGWLMVRRPGAAPFCLHVAQILNAELHPEHGPFVVTGERVRGVEVVAATD